MKNIEAYGKERFYISSEQFKPIFYSGYLGVGEVYFPYPLDLLNKVIVFENKYPLVFTGDLKNRFILAKVTKEHTVNMKTIEVLGDYPTIEKAFQETYLKGFNKVINDGNYYDEIPLINELTHAKGGILSDSKLSLSVVRNPDNWKEFEILVETTTLKDNPILVMR